MEILIAVIITALLVDQVWRYRMRKFSEETRATWDECANDIAKKYQEEIDKLLARVAFVEELLARHNDD